MCHCQAATMSTTTLMSGAMRTKPLKMINTRMLAKSPDATHEVALATQRHKLIPANIFCSVASTREAIKRSSLASKMPLKGNSRGGNKSSGVFKPNSRAFSLETSSADSVVKWVSIFRHGAPQPKPSSKTKPPVKAAVNNKTPRLLNTRSLDSARGCAGTRREEAEDDEETEDAAGVRCSRSGVAAADGAAVLPSKAAWSSRRPPGARKREGGGGWVALEVPSGTAVSPVPGP
mmetsp:Transcript_126369/g.328081  ORF Transcript_126369/g.328081 Transcript_126369/m.328081 type:complete len:233 (+) Transcript_126369:254-952(+)